MQKSLLSVTLALFSLVGTGQAQVGQVGVSAPDHLSEVRARIVGLVQQGQIPSMAIAVAQGGQVIWEEGIGWADLERQIPATPQTVYPIGSLSKSLMATGVMALVERGQISLEDPVSELIAPAEVTAFEGNPVDIRVWHLLNMAAGIPHGWMIMQGPQHAPANAREKDALLNYIGKVVFPPGVLYHYSNYSIGLTEWLIERRTGQDLADYMRSEVFRTLGMTHTGVRLDSELLPHRAQRYSGSVHDLMLFGQFNLRNRVAGQTRILSEASLDSMHYFRRGPDTLFALGWFTGDALVSNGSVAGANSRLTVIPSHDLAVACVTNMTSGNSIADQICDEIVDVLLPNASSDRRATFQRYASVYETPYEPQLALMGVWTGVVKAIDGDQRLELEFGPEAAPRISLANQSPVDLENARYNAFSVLKGGFRGAIRTHPWQDAVEADIRLVLMRDGNRLYGYATAPFTSDEGNFSIPTYVSLTRR